MSEVKKSFVNAFGTSKDTPAKQPIPEVAVDPSVIDFRSLFKQAAALIQEQSLINVDPNTISLKSMELSKAKANSLLEALHNVTLVTHSAEILNADSQKFKRVDEMSVLNPLLKAFGQAAVVGENSMRILVKKLEEAEASMKIESGSLEEEETKARILNYMQEAYGMCIDNLNKIVAGSARLIQLERFSQGRPWGAAATSRGNIGYIDALDSGAKVPENGAPGATPARALTKEEIALAIKD